MAGAHLALQQLLQLLVVLAAFAGPTWAVQITNLKVPSTVQNGSDDVILDCEYNLHPMEIERNEEPVVKWFFRSKPGPVYQWIPGSRPKDLDILKGRLDLEYRASTNPSMAYRALRILQPTTELSGEWKCSVSTFTSEDFMVKKMVVFAPARRFEVAQSKPEEGTVNITCKALGVYPLPKMVIYQEISGTHKKGNITGQTRTVLRNPADRQSPHSIRNGTFDIAASALVLDRDVTGPTVIGCELSLPEANYTKKKSIVYYPVTGVFKQLTDENRGTISSGNPAIWTALLTLLSVARTLLGAQFFVPRSRLPGAQC